MRLPLTDVSQVGILDLEWTVLVFSRSPCSAGISLGSSVFVSDVTFLFNYHDFAKDAIFCMRNIQMISIPENSRMSKMFERRFFFQIPLLVKLFDKLYSLTNLLVVQPENLKQVCSEEQLVRTPALLCAPFVYSFLVPL